MAEFKKLSEVELLESSTDNTTVLVEDGGEIKRLPKSQIGGGGDNSYVVTFTEGNFVQEADWFQCSDNYDDMYDVLVNGGMVWLDPSQLAGIPLRELIISWSLAGNGLFVETISSLKGDRGFLFPNGSHNLPAVSNPE